jgi:hypothetical protein
MLRRWRNRYAWDLVRKSTFFIYFADTHGGLGEAITGLKCENGGHGVVWNTFIRRLSVHLAMVVDFQLRKGEERALAISGYSLERWAPNVLTRLSACLRC